MTDRKKKLSAKLTLLLVRALAKLPFRAGLKVGTFLGHLLRILAVKRRRVTQVNIRLCFPELNSLEQQQLVKDVFIATGIGLVETAWTHYASAKMFSDKIEVRGETLLHNALEEGKGVVLLGAHFSTLDLGSLLFASLDIPLNTIYRRHNNPVLDRAITARRQQYSEPIERKNMRQVIRKLKANQCIWYAPDQDFGIENSVFTTFFGHTAATVTATSNLLRFNDSKIVMLAHYRKPDNSGYLLEFSEVAACDYNDKEAFAQVINDTIEAAIRKQPDQYMWTHKRFKTQPDGKHKIYKAANC